MSEEAGSSGVPKEVKETEPKVEDEPEEEEEQGVTMLDVLEEERDLEQDANAVLGGSDDQNCTYSEGYVPRQALYACNTCLPVTGENFKPAGVCLACSYNCHEGHDLVELYTKRNFKCDCGNSKFGDKKCTLDQNKSAENEENKYNQNFSGLYCSCSRPYPDPEDPVEDEMLQCIVCEDWFHGRHLVEPAMTSIATQNFSEMICGTCMEKNTFLWHYAKEFGVSAELTNTSVDVTAEEPSKATPTAVKAPEEAIDQNVAADPAKAEEGTKQEEAPTEATGETAEAATPAEEDKVEAKPEAGADKPTTSEIPAGEAPGKSEECFLKGKRNAAPEKRATFWPTGWRKQLCTCKDCETLYADQGVSFLPKEEDMVQTYEEAGQQKLATNGSQYEQGMRALSNMDRVRQVEAIGEYNQMKVELKDFLAKFAATKRVVREEDIQGFFQELKAKRCRTDSIPHFCH